MSEHTQTAKKASIIDFFRGVMVELQRVDWPSREKTIQLTAIVIVVSVTMGVFIGGLDISFTKVVESILTK